MKIADAVKGPIFDVSGSEDPPAAAPSASQVRQSRAPEASRAANQMASDEPGPIHWNESPVTNLKTGASLRLSRGDDPTKESPYDENHPRSSRGGGPYDYAIGSWKHPPRKPRASKSALAGLGSTQFERGAT
jgi:hypothetical protein